MKKISYLACFLIIAAVVAFFLHYTHLDGIRYSATNIARHVSDVATKPLAPMATANETLCVPGRPCTYEDVVDIRVIVIAFNRAVSLSKLLLTVQAMEVDGDRAALEIWIDRDRRSGNVDQQTLEEASVFNWKRGPTRVHVQVSCSEIKITADVIRMTVM